MCATVRKKLVENVTHARKKIDMEWVYKEIDNGRSVKSIAAELGVSETTIRRRHHDYQQSLEAIQPDQEYVEVYNYDSSNLSEII